MDPDAQQEYFNTIYDNIECCLGQYADEHGARNMCYTAMIILLGEEHIGHNRCPNYHIWWTRRPTLYHNGQKITFPADEIWDPSHGTHVGV